MNDAQLVETTAKLDRAFAEVEECREMLAESAVLVRSILSMLEPAACIPA